MSGEERVLTTREILELELRIPEGHRHLRAILHLAGGERLVLQEATVAALVRAYTTVKTHPETSALRLVGREMAPGEKKPEFASWQLLEEE